MNQPLPSVYVLILYFQQLFWRTGDRTLKGLFLLGALALWLPEMAL